MQKGQSHPAAQVSKTMISGALKQLIHEVGYREITITLLCERAQIARRTFYRNFDAIEAVLRYIGGQTIDALCENLQRHAGETKYDLLVAFFSFWVEHRDTFALFANNDLTYILFSSYIQSLSRMPFFDAPDPAVSGAVNACLQAYSAGGLWSMLMFQNNLPNPLSPEELARVILQHPIG